MNYLRKRKQRRIPVSSQASQPARRAGSQLHSSAGPSRAIEPSCNDIWLLPAQMDESSSNLMGGFKFQCFLVDVRWLSVIGSDLVHEKLSTVPLVAELGRFLANRETEPPRSQPLFARAHSSGHNGAASDFRQTGKQVQVMSSRAAKSAIVAFV